MEKKKKPFYKPVSPPRRAEEGGHGSSWKVAYADFVTAMMAFFLLMWIVGMVPKEQLRQIESYFQEDGKPQSQGVGGSGTHLISSRSPKLNEEQKNRMRIVSELKALIQEDPALAASSGISSDDVGVLLRVGGDAMFEPGSATLTPSAIKVVDEARKILLDYNLYLLIRGHAGGTESSGLYPSAWELSGARSAAAARRILEGGRIMPSRVRAVAYADTRPLLPPNTPEGKLANQRVEFYFHRPEVMSYQVVY